MPFPKFSQLPINKGDPLHSAWGVFDKNGEKDQVGTLNHLTNERVAAAAQLIRTGQRVSLDWPLNKPDFPYLHRATFQQHIINKAPRVINDDVLMFNTQQSSQWDSFKHFAYQKEARFYNGVTLEETVGPTRTNRNGIQNFAKHGIAGRGVLLDIYGFSQKTGKTYNPHSTHGITLEELKECAKAENVTFKAGDILLVRTGHIAEYGKLADANAKINIAAQAPQFAGVKQDVRTLEWIWDTQFAAVAADNCAFEQQPPSPDADFGMMHPILLSGFGCPIGELFDLEELAKACEKEKRWEFFMTSAPLMVPGGVASPPNAMAIF